MSRIVYVNGAYRPHREARVHFEDRGYQFSDGVYEVILVRKSVLVDAEPHLARLVRSLTELDIAPPMDPPALEAVIAETMRRNRLVEGFVYIQATRGVAARDHLFPKAPKAALVISARARDWPALGAAPAGVAAKTVRDIRWGRCDIKSVGLLPNVLAKEEARKAGAGEAILVSEAGIVHEGGSSNVWIVDAAGALHTHPLGPEILGGVTRQAVKRLAEEAQIRVVEEPFTEARLREAREVFVTSATSFVKPIVEIDGAKVADGAVGPVTRRVFDIYNAHTLGVGPS